MPRPSLPVEAARDVLERAATDAARGAIDRDLVAAAQVVAGREASDNGG